MTQNVHYYTHISTPMGNTKDFLEQWNTIKGVQDTMRLLDEWISNATTHLGDIEESYHLDTKSFHDFQERLRIGV